MKSVFILILSHLAIAAPLKTVKVGVMYEKEGVDLGSPDYLPSLPVAAELAVKERSAELKKAGVEVQVVRLPTPANAVSAFNTVKSAVAGDYVAIIGFQSSDECLAGAENIRNTDLLAVSPMATSNELRQFLPNWLQYAANSKEVADNMEFFVTRELKPKKIVAIVTWDSPYARNMFESFRPEFKNAVKLFKTDEGLSDLATIVTTAIEAKPDLILLPNYGVPTASLIKALSNAGYNGVFFGGDSWGEGNDKRFMAILSGVSFKGYTVRQFTRFKTTKNQEKLKNQIESVMGFKYASAAALYYSATDYVLDLIKLEGPKVSRARLLERSKKVRRHRGLFGTACLSQESCAGRAFNVIKVSENGFEFYKTLTVRR